MRFRKQRKLPGRLILLDVRFVNEFEADGSPFIDCYKNILIILEIQPQRGILALHFFV